MDLTLSEHEQRIYEVWMHSPSVFSSNPAETILAFKIAKQVQHPASRVLKALRGQPGLDEGLVRDVEAFVENEPNLIFVDDGPQRVIALSEVE